MQKRTGNEIRQLFLDYFKKQKHMVEPSVSLVPINDPTLLWINAGVAGLKKYFDGREKPSNNRITNVQKCIRTNDIENVGKTSRHHTFFEMLGNFSIGDYFKEDAIKFAWEFLTSPEWIGFEKEKMYVTIYPDDEQAYKIWTEIIKLPSNHILKSEDNFWQIGEGPCGPDSEIYYDRGEKYDPDHLGEKLFFEEMENDRYIEVWNVVFSQFDAKDGVERKDFKELPQKNIDTGMGLERLVSLVQDGETNFDTDLFMPIIKKAEEFTSIKYDEVKMPYRIIADHIRTCVFALSDGAIFSNDGRGYVLRRVLRRAMKYARKLNINKPFLYELVDTVCEMNKPFYPYLLEKKDFAKKLILKEEESFITTLENGEKLLEDALSKVKDNKLDGSIIFKLYDTYGFPKEMTIESAQEKGIECDLEGFEKCMNNQKEMARNARSEAESMHNQSADLLNLDTKFLFTGYEKLDDTGKVVALFVNGKKVQELSNEGDIVFDKSCLYAESGGQCADKGYIELNNKQFDVLDVKKAPNGQFLHHVNLNGQTIKVGDTAKQFVDKEFRRKVMANHSSLHLLQSALRKVLGNHVAQAGSYVCDEYARFDFSHFEKISEDQLKQIEELVNSFIFNEYDVITDVLSIDEAKKTNAIALFDEKYGDTVRVVSMGDVSKEFCGGTHVSNTSKLGSFKILSEESIGSGIRRIQCCTKSFAYNSLKHFENKMNQLKDDFKLKNVELVYDKIQSLVDEHNQLQAKFNELLKSTMELEAKELSSKAIDNGKFKYLIVKEKDCGFNLREFAISIRNKIDNGLVVILNETKEKYSFVIASGKKSIEAGCNAKSLIQEISKLSNCKGGGNDDFAQAGCSNDGSIDKTIEGIKNLLK